VPAEHRWRLAGFIATIMDSGLEFVAVVCASRQVSGRAAPAISFPVSGYWGNPFGHIQPTNRAANNYVEVRILRLS
jgi:hypothetical protein